MHFNNSWNIIKITFLGLCITILILCISDSIDRMFLFSESLVPLEAEHQWNLYMTMFDQSFNSGSRSKDISCITSIYEVTPSRKFTLNFVANDNWKPYNMYESILQHMAEELTHKWSGIVGPSLHVPPIMTFWIWSDHFDSCIKEFIYKWFW